MPMESGCFHRHKKMESLDDMIESRDVLMKSIKVCLGNLLVHIIRYKNF